MPSYSPSPGRKLQGGGVGGTPQLLLGSQPRPFLQGESLGLGGVPCSPGFRVGAAHCPPPSPPPHGPQAEKVTPVAASGGLGGGGSESSRPMSLLRNLPPPPPPPSWPLGKAQHWLGSRGGAQCRLSSDAPPTTTTHQIGGFAFRLHGGLTGPRPQRTIRAPSCSSEASPSVSAPPRTDKYLS